MTEEWREVPSARTYEVSSLGRVRRAGYARPSGKPRLLRGCVFQTGYRYIQTTLEANAACGKRAHAVHRMVCEAFHGPAPFAGAVARHLDGDRSNNTPANLAWGTTSENAADRRLHGRDRLGCDHHGARLIDEHEVLAVFALSRRGLISSEIAQIFGVNASSISRVLSREAWGHVEVPTALLDDADACVVDEKAPRFSRLRLGPLGGRAA